MLFLKDFKRLRKHLDNLKSERLSYNYLMFIYKFKLIAMNS